MSSAPKGRAVIEVLLDSSKLNKNLKTIEDNFKKVGANIAKVGAGFAGFGTGLIGGLLLAANQAGDAAEVFNRFQAVFKSAADDVKKFTAETAKALGRTESDLISTATSFGAFFIGLGRSREEAAGLSKELTQLSLDFASFNNVTDADAQQRFLSALSGSSEVFDKFGINTKAAALDQEFLRQGLDKTTATASETEKVFARLAIIAKALGKQGAIGDAAKTTDSYNNSVKSLTSSLKTLIQTIGKPLLSTFAQVAKVISRLVEASADYIRQNPKFVKGALAVGTAATASGAALLILGGSFIGVGLLAGGFSAAVTGITSALVILKGSVLAIGGVITAVLASPLTSVAIILTSLIAKFADFNGVAKATTEAVSKDFKTAFATGRENFDLLVDAIKSGQLQQAAKIASNGVKLALLQAFDTPIRTAIKVLAVLKQALNGLGSGFDKLALSGVKFTLIVSKAASTGADAIYNAYRIAFLRIKQALILVGAGLRSVFLGITSDVKAAIEIASLNTKGAEVIRKVAEQERKNLASDAQKAVAKIEESIKKKFKSEFTVKLESGIAKLNKSTAKVDADRAKRDDQIINIAAKQLMSLDDLKGLFSKNVIDAGRVVKDNQAKAGDSKAVNENTNKIGEIVNRLRSQNNQFGQLVETGSSQAIKLFGQNNNKNLKELQGIRQGIDAVVENTAGLRVI